MLAVLSQLSGFFSKSTQLATDNRQRTTDNRQPTTDNRQPTTDNRQQTTDNGEQTTDNGEQTTDNRQRTTNNRQRITLILLFFLISCSSNPKDINTDESVETIDFINAFPAKELPIQFQQKDLNQKESDSFFVKPAVVSKFLPDSIFKSSFGKAKDIRFYRKGRYKAEETEETYLFLSAEKKGKKLIYVVCFDKDNVFKAALPLVEKTTDERMSMEGMLDKKLTIIKFRNRNTGDGKSFYNKSAYVYNTEGLFTLILTESNEPIEEKMVYNPIDTLAKKDPLSGDYRIDKKNFVSVRDGGKPGKLLFFINIEKAGNSCDGSLRGDMSQVRPKVFQYNKADDHCILEFSFSGRSLQVKELEACGNHRGVRCSFDGRFRK